MTLYAMALVAEEQQEGDAQRRLDEIRTLAQGLCRDVRRRGQQVVATPLSAEEAHQTCWRILERARTADVGGSWKIGVAGGLDPGDVASEASQLADAATLGQVLIGEAVYCELEPRSRARYLRPKDVAGYRACRIIPPGYRRCFVVLPMGADHSTERARSEAVVAKIIEPACAQLRHAVVHPGQQDGENVWADISNSLTSADLIIAYLGSAPWNPNVMLEVGYRLASGKPLVVLAPEGELPFDLKNHRTIILPADPTTLSRQDAASKVTELVEMAARRATRDRGWAGLYPTATIDVDRRPGVAPEFREHRIAEASEQTARLFAIERGDLIGMPPSLVLERLGKLMDKTQYDAFLKEQARLYQQLSGDDTVVAGPREMVYAEVPIVLTRHPDPAHYLRAFLPMILSNDQVGERAFQRVVYVDVSRYIRKSDQGVYRVPRPAPNIDFVFAQYAGSYDNVLLALPHYRETLDRHLALVAPHDSMQVLDLGAGTGNLTLRLLQAGATVTAIDKSQDMLNVLKRKCQGFGTRLVVQRRNGSDLTGLASGSFDVVNVMLVLFAVDEPKAMLREARRVLRPGGTLLLTEPNETFDMAVQLREAEQHLATAGLLGSNGAPGSLAADWDVVRKVNQAFSDTVHDAWKAEQAEDDLRSAGWDDPETTPAYGTQCTTIRAVKPKGS